MFTLNLASQDCMPPVSVRTYPGYRPHFTEIEAQIKKHISLVRKDFGEA